MVVGLLVLDLHMPHARSLKDKRQIIRSILDRIKGKYNVSAAEVDHHDLWQRATLGVSYVTMTPFEAHKVLGAVARYVESLDKAVVAGREISMLAP